jgi:adenosyl cobinamide kinase/adenosyl cobinamide phosphate guanylyltransferase
MHTAAPTDRAVVRLRARSSVVLAVTSAVGLVAFGWPFLTDPGSALDTSHAADAPWLFVVLLPLLALVVLAELTEGGLDAKAVALLGMLSAVGAALRVLGPGTAGLEPGFALIILGGRVFGRGFGFVLGALTIFSGALVSGGVGPWMPFQMLGAAWVGFLAGCLPDWRGRAEIWVVAAYGFLAGLAYGWLLNLWFWPFAAYGPEVSFVAGDPVGENAGRYLLFWATTSLGWDIPRGCSPPSSSWSPGRRSSPPSAGPRSAQPSMRRSVSDPASRRGPDGARRPRHRGCRRLAQPVLRVRLVPCHALQRSGARPDLGAAGRPAPDRLRRRHSTQRRPRRPVPRGRDPRAAHPRPSRPLRPRVSPLPVLGHRGSGHRAGAAARHRGVPRLGCSRLAVRLRPIAPGQHVDCGGYGVTAVPATHLGEGAALLYDVTGPDGSRLLYASDTGPLRAAAVRAVTDAAYDVVLLEETFGAAAVPRGDHLNFASFGETLDELRAAGAVTAATDVIAVHLSHANPPEPQLADRLAGYGARLVDDGAVMPVGPAGQAPVIRTLVLGGARSGKSRRSEVLLRSEPEVVYVATAKAMPGDAEWDRRVAAHRARRPASWRTVETTDLEGLLAEPGAPLLVDCLTLWLTAVMDECSAWDDDRWADDAEQRVAERVDALAAAVRGSRRTLVMVSNEVGSGVVPATASGRRFRDALGRLNTVVAQSSDRVLLCVAGRSLELEP